MQKLKLGTRNKPSRTLAEGYKLVDTSLLQQVLNQCYVCKFCKKKLGKLDILEEASTRKGLAESLFLNVNIVPRKHTLIQVKVQVHE